MSRYFLGVDAGATKTDALVMDEDGCLVGCGRSGAGNHEVYGFDHARRSIADAVASSMRQARIGVDDVGQACFCLAGVDVGQDYGTIPEKILDPLFANLKYSLKNDAFGCLRGGTRLSFGIMINCGTGQVAVGRNRQGMELRIGGYGFEFGDFSGGSAITQAAVAAVVRAEDGRGEPTELTRLLLQAAEQDSVAAFIDRTYRDSVFLSSLGIPQITFRASSSGDHVARRIILDAAGEMAVTAVALIRRLAMQEETFDLITAGSVFKGDDDAFLHTIRSNVHAVAPHARFCVPLYPPVVGAVLLACEQTGQQVSDKVYARLEKSMPRELKA